MAASVSSSSSLAKRRSRAGVNPMMGFHFQPTEQQLLHDFLLTKVQGNPLPLDIVDEIDLYSYDPEQLPRYSELWLEGMAYYFAKTMKRYTNGSRRTRSTPGGFWRGTGIETDIQEGNKTIGFRRILVFYRGRASSGMKTSWVMHEYRLNQNLDLPKNPNNPQMANFVLCKVFRKTSQIDTKDVHGKRKREEFEVHENKENFEDAQEGSSREEFEVLQGNKENFEDGQSRSLQASSGNESEVLQETQSKSLQGSSRVKIEVLQENNENFEDLQSKSLQESSMVELEVLQEHNKNFKDIQNEALQGTLEESQLNFIEDMFFEELHMKLEDIASHEFVIGHPPYFP